MVRCNRSTFPLRCGVNPGSRTTRTHNAAITSRTASAAKSNPRSTRTAAGTAPNGPRASSYTNAIRNAVNTVPVCGVNAIAQPTSARVPSSTTDVNHGRTPGPRGGNTTTGSSLWSSSHTSLRRACGRDRYTSALRRPSSPTCHAARSPGVSCSANARCNVRNAIGAAPAHPSTRKSGTGAPAAPPAPATTAARARATAATLPRKCA